MAQSAITVTPSNPTPPTNFANVFVGTTPPTAPAQAQVDDGTAGALTAFAAPAASADSANYPSLAAEGAGTEVVVTAPGSRAECPTQSMSDLGSYTTSPNQQHASSLSPATNPTLSSISPASTASGSGTVALTATGVGFTKQSVITVNGVAQTTTFVSSTSLTANPTKRSSAGTWPVAVVTGGAVITAPQTWTFT